MLTYQGEVGISATIFFEALTGEIVTSHLDLHNEGSTVIFYSWQQLPKPYNFPNLRLQTQKVHFYFNASSGNHTNMIRTPAANICTSYTACLLTHHSTELSVFPVAFCSL